MITLKGVDPRMIANNITPYEPTHPGEILKEEIEFRGISQRRLALIINPQILHNKNPTVSLLQKAEKEIIIDFGQRAMPFVSVLS